MLNMNLSSLEASSVDIKTLANNLTEVLPDCSGAGVDVKSEIINRFPLVNWLLGTELTGRVRGTISREGMCIFHKDESGKWVIDMPKSVWTEAITSQNTECCWVAPDLAKCGGSVPINLLCLKDCQPKLDQFIEESLRMTSRGSLPPISNAQDSIAEVRRRFDRMTMAFLTAYTVVLGDDETYTDILKPFHGVYQVMSNPGVAAISGVNTLSAFESLACRLAFLGGSNYVFALNPVVYQTLLTFIVPDMFGRLPAGWSRTGDSVSFRGIRFIQDRFVPIDLENGTGEIWLLNGDSVGLYLATDLMPGDRFIFDENTHNDNPEQGCAAGCRYYYNYGAVLNNNANRLAKIVDIPLSGACADVVSDFAGLIMPDTLIPNIGVTQATGGDGGQGQS